MAATFPITIEQGSDFRLGLTLMLGGLVMSLPGWASRMQIRSADSPTSDLYFNLREGHELTTDGAAGTIDIFLPAATTRAFVMPPGKPRVMRNCRRVFILGVYNLEIFGDGQEQRLFEGPVYFSGEVIP